MTREERRAIVAFANCRFLPGSWPKRLAKSLAAINPLSPLSPRQREALLKQLHHYRRQLPRDVVEWTQRQQRGEDMNEAEWLACDEPRLMLTHLDPNGPPKASLRKLRLFVAGCFRERWDSEKGPQSPEGKLFAAIEAFADGGDELDMLQAWDNAPLVRRAKVAFGTVSGTRIFAKQMGDMQNPVRICRRAAILRDIFGNPFRPNTARHEWLTPQVLSMAQRIYDERDYSADALGVLADALEDADCPADGDLVRHLRGLDPCPACFGTGSECDPSDLGKPYDVTLWQCTRCDGRKWTPLRGPHVRGCWAVDVILGKT